MPLGTNTSSREKHKALLLVGATSIFGLYMVQHHQYTFHAHNNYHVCATTPGHACCTKC